MTIFRSPGVEELRKTSSMNIEYTRVAISTIVTFEYNNHIAWLPFFAGAQTISKIRALCLQPLKLVSFEINNWVFFSIGIRIY